MPDAHAAITTRNFTGEQLQRSKQILASTQEFLDGVLAAGKITQQQLSSWAWSLTPLMDQHINDSAVALLNKYVA